MKYQHHYKDQNSFERRSREGAWIEMILSAVTAPAAICRSREGAWIEMVDTLIALITPSCRSREGAWIEIKGYSTV